jgi:hypothetical protein
MTDSKAQNVVIKGLMPDQSDELVEMFVAEANAMKRSVATPRTSP